MVDMLFFIVAPSFSIHNHDPVAPRAIHYISNTVPHPLFGGDPSRGRLDYIIQLAAVRILKGYRLLPIELPIRDCQRLSLLTISIFPVAEILDMKSVKHSLSWSWIRA